MTATWTEQFRIKPDTDVKLDSIPWKQDGGFDKDDGKATFKRLLDRLDEQQKMLYAQHEHAVLVVLQAMDAGGKDSTIRKVFGPLNPQGVRVTSFKAPNSLELKHDFLWRIHAKAPSRGYIRIFNRSHYEDVLIVRVKDLVPPQRWQKRYRHINDFEAMLHDEGVTILKFYLHISKDYQREQFQERLDEPDKHWKFNPGDLPERARWDEYQQAYEAALSKCSTDHAPWYVVPAERRWFRNLLVAQVMVNTLDSLGLAYPEPDFDPKTFKLA